MAAAARVLKIAAIAFTGAADSALTPNCDILVSAPSLDVPRIQEIVSMESCGSNNVLPMGMICAWMPGWNCHEDL